MILVAGAVAGTVASLLTLLGEFGLEPVGLKVASVLDLIAAGLIVAALWAGATMFDSRSVNSASSSGALSRVMMLLAGAFSVYLIGSAVRLIYVATISYGLHIGASCAAVAGDAFILQLLLRRRERTALHQSAGTGPVARHAPAAAFARSLLPISLAAGTLLVTATVLDKFDYADTGVATLGLLVLVALSVVMPHMQRGDRRAGIDRLKYTLAVIVFAVVLVLMAFVQFADVNDTDATGVASAAPWLALVASACGLVAVGVRRLVDD